jgi:hypothetical protein
LLLLVVEIGLAPADEVKHAAESKVEGKTSATPAKPFRLLQRPAKMEITGHVRLTTLDNQPSYVQMGSRVPRVTGVSVTAAGAMQSTSMENVGLLVGVTPRISSDGMVTMQLDRGRGRQNSPHAADRPDRRADDRQDSQRPDRDPRQHRIAEQIQQRTSGCHYTARPKP